MSYIHSQAEAGTVQIACRQPRVEHEAARSETPQNDIAIYVKLSLAKAMPATNCDTQRRDMI